MRCGSINLILAVSENWVIGVDNKLPWHCKNDMDFFKKTTKGFPVVMGRKTFLSLGKPLIQRANYVLSGSANFSGVTMLRGLEEIKLLAKTEDIFIIGGKDMYEHFAKMAKNIYLTVVKINVQSENAVSIDKSILSGKTGKIIEKHDDCEIYLYT
jgi:dihydrofolate reductase